LDGPLLGWDSVDVEDVEVGPLAAGRDHSERGDELAALELANGALERSLGDLGLLDEGADRGV
jgi:hypothetical protein